MEPLQQMLLTIITSVLASSGLWAYIVKMLDKRDIKTTMLLGLAHDRIHHLGMVYIERGWITQDEYENLKVYLYEPYEKMGGNGSGSKIMQEVEKLPIKPNGYTEEISDENE